MTIAASPAFRLMTLAILSLLAGPLMTACSTTKQDSLNVPLAFRPERVTPGLHSELIPSPGLRLHLAPVVDARALHDRIGENIEDSEMGPRPIYAEGMSPDVFVYEILARELMSVGYAPGADAAGANRILTVKLDRFFTVESNLYRCEVAISSEVRSEAGQVLWQGRSVGKSQRFGRSLSLENYNQSFSDATLRAIADLLSKDDFRVALTVK